MDNSVTVTLTTHDVVWRFQGDVRGGDVLDSTIELLLQREYRDESGEVYKTISLESIKGTPQQLGFYDEFESIKKKLTQIMKTPN